MIYLKFAAQVAVGFVLTVLDNIEAALRRTGSAAFHLASAALAGITLVGFLMALACFFGLVSSAKAQTGASIWWGSPTYPQLHCIPPGDSDQAVCFDNRENQFMRAAMPGHGSVMRIPMYTYYTATGLAYLNASYFYVHCGPQRNPQTWTVLTAEQAEFAYLSHWERYASHSVHLMSISSFACRATGARNFISVGR